jgi:hypothetical protein
VIVLKTNVLYINVCSIFFFFIFSHNGIKYVIIKALNSNYLLIHALD